MVSSAFHSTKAVAIVGPAEDDPPLYKIGSKPVAVCKGESGALN